MRKRDLLRMGRVSMALMAVAILAGCSTQKNTPATRWWHSFNARYNTYYNATLAYIDGSKEKEQGNKDNYTEQIPLYTVANKESRDLGAGNFDRAIEKCKKAIQLHSIKKRPVWDKNRKKTAKDIEWLNRREYNPFLWKAWLLMGRSQFHKGDFEGAATTFAYMARLYATQPAIYGRARAWLAKCYTELEWYYDAEEVIRDTHRDSIHWRARKEWDYTLADYYIRTKDTDKAIQYLRQVIKHEMRRKQKAREYFLLGQLLASQGKKDEAYKAYRSVLRQHPPYELAFNARIAMTEVTASKNTKSTIRRLRRMAASDNNRDYLDQVFYAIGNVYLAQGDTAQAISAYEEGNRKATRSGVEKGVLLLKLGDLYWQQERFGDARRCYGEALGLLDTDRDDYETLSTRSKILDELVPHTETIHLQDSLQELALMSEADRNAAIDRVIEQLKRKEKEERDRQADAEMQQMQAQNQTGAFQQQQQRTNQVGGTGSSTWYFYNPMAVQQGKTTFQRQWGKRENVDNWQRSNVTVVASDTAEETTDETINEEQTADEEAPPMSDEEAAQADPHNRAYYLAQIPFTEEQRQASDLLLTEALYQAGVILKDKLDLLPASARMLTRLVEQYPSFGHMDDVYYHLFLLYSRQGDTAMAQHYLQLLTSQHPESQWTALLTDPYFEENARYGIEIEDSLYTATYEAFRKGRYTEVDDNARLSDRRFPNGANRDKFLFVGALSQLYNGRVDSCLAGMKRVVREYPDSRLSEMAGMIINGVNAGRVPQGGRFDLADVWNYRSLAAAGQDSSQVKDFSPEPDVPFIFMLVYQPDSINENQLLFEVAKFNFTTYLARGFDIAIEAHQGVHRMQLTGFRNYQEARQYARAVYAQEPIMRLLGNGRAYVISQENLALIGTQKAYTDYERFYLEHFAALQEAGKPLLWEPDVIVTGPEPERQMTGLPADDTPQTEQEQAEDDETWTVPAEEEGLVIPADEETIVPAATETEMEIPAEEPAAPAVPANDNEIVVPAEESAASAADTQLTIEPEEEAIQLPAEETTPANTQTELIIPEEEEEPVAPANEEQLLIPVTPGPAPQQTQSQQAAPAEDVEIYFEEDLTLPADAPATNSEQPVQEGFDLDDEYYDLEGF